jgi:catalase-peroxidase
VADQAEVRRQISWADLMVLTGNVALESMGFKTFGFAGGREDDWEADMVYWGPESRVARGQALQRRSHSSNAPRRGADGPDLRESGRPQRQPGSARGSEGHPRNLRPHGDERRRDRRPDRRWPHLRQGAWRARPGEVPRSGARRCRPRAAGPGLENKCGKGNAEDTITSGLEGAWTTNPIAWTSQYLDNLFMFEWVQTKSPAGAIQWVPKRNGSRPTRAGRARPTKRHAPIMFTTDLSLKFDPEYRKISRALHRKSAGVRDAFAAPGSS